MDEVDKFLVDFSFNDLKLDIYGRYRDDTFIPWLHGIDNLLNFKQALYEHIKSICPNINFTTVYDCKEIQLLDLTVYVENSFLKTKIFSTPTGNHEYLDVRSSYQQAVLRSIPRTVANRVRRNCTDDSEFVIARSEYSNYILTVANRVRRNCTDDSEFVIARSEYSNYILRAGYNVSSPVYISRNFSTYD